jgi:predicted O-methyltransferase YrrM
MTEYQFTQDWFHWAPEVWEQLIPLLPERKAFLEIGSFEGRSAVWIAENMADEGSHIDCIDTWQGGEEHSEEDMAAVEARFDENARQVNGYYRASRLVSKFKGTSTQWLARFLDSPGCTDHEYNFIYIDGSHIAKDVLTDACMAWPLLKKGGIMVLDDYMWGEPRDILHRPKLAIDSFINIFAEEINIVHVGYQMVIQKKGE